MKISPTYVSVPCACGCGRMIEVLSVDSDLDHFCDECQEVEERHGEKGPPYDAATATGMYDAW